MPALKSHVRADDVETMKRELQSLFEQYLQRRLQVLLAQNRDFDEETSLGHNPEKQRKWLKMVRSKLPLDDSFGAAQ
jgi:septum formation topological specificity factor MinE